MEFNVGDYVTRNSYNNDTIFEIVDFILKHRNEVNWVDKYMAL